MLSLVLFALIQTVTTNPPKSFDVSSNGWLALGTVLAGLAAVATLVWSMRQERQKRADDRVLGDNENVDRSLRRSLDAFDELVANLQKEVERLYKDRETLQKQAQVNEDALRDEIGKLRREVRMLRTALAKNGITVPDV